MRKAVLSRTCSLIHLYYRWTWIRNCQIMCLSLQRCKCVSGDHRWIHHSISCVHLLNSLTLFVPGWRSAAWHRRAWTCDQKAWNLHSWKLNGRDVAIQRKIIDSKKRRLTQPWYWYMMTYDTPDSSKREVTSALEIVHFGARVKRSRDPNTGSSCLCNNIQDKPFFEDSNTLPKPFKRKLWVILGWVAEIMHQMHQLLGIVSPSIFIYSRFLNHSRWLARILPSTSDMKILSKGDCFKAGDIFHQEVTAYRRSKNWKHTNWQQQKHMLQKQCKHTITSLKRISFK